MNNLGFFLARGGNEENTDLKRANGSVLWDKLNKKNCDYMDKRLVFEYEER